jgi:serine/threonine protein kinase
MAAQASPTISRGSTDPPIGDSTIAMVPSELGSPSAALRIQRWGHLDHLEKVGQGLSGEVFRAWDGQLQREVALKLCRRNGTYLEDADSFVLQEARLLARIRHPNVVTVYGVDQHNGWLGVWMEFIRGKTLESLISDQGRLGAREATLIGLDLCSALVVVHGLGLLHRDIKARNVMREDGGRIVLMDFGLSQDLRVRSSQERGQDICGTPLYMAPELLRGEQASVQSDIYGVGVLLYHLVSDAFPVEARSLTEVRRAHERGHATLLRDRRSDLSEPFVRAVERALSLDPAERFSSAGQMAQALSASFGISYR